MTVKIADAADLRGVPRPAAIQPVGWKPEDYPNAMKAGRQTVSLPLSPKLSDEDVEDVVGAVTQVLGV